MAWFHGGQPVPKPVKGTARRTRKTERLSRERAFRNAVWLRASGRCERCGVDVIRTLDVLHPRAGHVAHHRGRRVAPADRCNPDAASLLCRDCHMAEHSMRFG